MGGEDADKIVRIPGDTLIIKLSPEEVKYRNKYLPDPTKLTDEKLVCTVCSVHLAQNIHKGKDIYVHRALHVLVCEACYNFYGDGCFSADEDGDDKFCRWCGQGGTLYLCSTCTCAFCQKCVKQNLKPAVIAELENDDWKCYICNPRPLFGCRAICWGAEELNKIGKSKEQERLKKQKERLEKLEEKQKEENGRRSRKVSSEDEISSKKRKKRFERSDSSSPEVMPTKRSKRDSKNSAVTRNLNGSIGRSRRRRDSSSDSEASEDSKKVVRHSRSRSKKNQKLSYQSPESDSDLKNKQKLKFRKKSVRDSSGESSDEDRKKSKRKSSKKRVDTSQDESSDDKRKKNKKLYRKKKEKSSDSSSDDRQRKIKQKKKLKETSSEESDDDDKKNYRRKKAESSNEDSDLTRKSKIKKKIKEGTESRKKETLDSVSELKRGKKSNDLDDTLVDEKAEDSKSKVTSKRGSSAVENAVVRKKIKLAILWLDNTVKDISELGNLISMRATKFAKKKINADNLKSYDDVLNTVTKLKQLISGVHSNYDHIEKSLDAQVKPWRCLVGLEEPEGEKPVEMDVSNDVDKNVSKIQELPLVITQESKDTSKTDTNFNISCVMPENNLVLEKSIEQEEEWNKTSVNKDEDDNISLRFSALSGDVDKGDGNETEALISRASETLSQIDEEEEQQSNGKNDTNKTKISVTTNENDKTTLPDSDEKERYNETLQSSNLNSKDESKVSDNKPDKIKPDEASKHSIMKTEKENKQKSIIKDKKGSVKQNANESAQKKSLSNESKSTVEKDSGSDTDMETSVKNLISH